jgi:hypothetical protein
LRPAVQLLPNVLLPGSLPDNLVLPIGLRDELRQLLPDEQLLSLDPFPPQPLLQQLR